MSEPQPKSLPRNPRLHQILAIESGVRNQTKKDITALHHALKKKDLLFGLTKVYEPLDEEGEQIPEEQKLLQVRTPEALRLASQAFVEIFDITAARDFANCEAKADVVLEDGTVILNQVPAIYLLWMEKQLTDLHTFVSELPTLPTDAEWEFDDQQNAFKSQEIKTARKLKTPYPLVLSPATDKHPANVIEKTKEEVVGYFKATRYSGAMKVQDVSRMKGRVEKLQRAVKFAREQANTVDAPKQNIGSKITEFVFGDISE